MNVGTSPWISVSTDPIVMTMKPQKMKKWYLLPIAVTNFGSRLAGSVVASTTFFWPKKNTSTEASRSFGRSERPSGRAAASIRMKRRAVHANIARAATRRIAKAMRLIRSIS